MLFVCAEIKLQQGYPTCGTSGFPRSIESIEKIIEFQNWFSRP